MEENRSCWYFDCCNHAECPECVDYKIMRMLMRNSNLPEAKQRAIKLDVDGNSPDYDKFVRLNEIKHDIHNFVTSGKNLVIASNGTGNGKTSWAIKLLYSYLNSTLHCSGESCRALFVPVTWYLLKCKDFGSVDTEFQKIKKLIYNVDLVVWDDIATTTLTKFDYAHLYAALDWRVLAEKSNIFTSNIADSGSLEAMLDARLARRIWGVSEIIKFEANGHKHD